MGSKLCTKKHNDSSSTEEEEDNNKDLSINYIKNNKQLICDDIYHNRLALGKYLTRFGYNYDEAENGLHALQLISEGNLYDIIWMDVKMPKLDGIKATKLARQKLFYTGKIIGLTGFVDKETIEKCLSVGMNKVLTKPLDKKIILHEIDCINDS
jgi:hypothetical protein